MAPKLRDGTALPPPSDERLVWFEQVYRVKLPDDFTTFLKTGNGAVPEDNTFDQNGQKRLVERFLCIVDAPREIGELGWYDITVVLTQIENRLIDDDDLVGTNMVPFAALFGGDFVCLDFREDPNLPEVVVWDHEESQEGEPCTTKVATSFSEFTSFLAAAP